MRHNNYLKVMYRGRKDDFVFFRSGDGVDTLRALQTAHAEAAAGKGKVCVWKRAPGIGDAIQVIGEFKDSEDSERETVYA